MPQTPLHLQRGETKAKARPGRLSPEHTQPGSHTRRAQGGATRKLCGLMCPGRLMRLHILDLSGAGADGFTAQSDWGAAGPGATLFSVIAWEELKTKSGMHPGTRNTLLLHSWAEPFSPPTYCLLKLPHCSCFSQSLLHFQENVLSKGHPSRNIQQAVSSSKTKGTVRDGSKDFWWSSGSAPCFQCRAQVGSWSRN